MFIRYVLKEIMIKFEIRNHNLRNYEHMCDFGLPEAREQRKKSYIKTLDFTQYSCIRKKLHHYWEIVMVYCCRKSSCMFYLWLLWALHAMSWNWVTWEGKLSISRCNSDCRWGLRDIWKKKLFFFFFWS